eukprot:CAMPEP_0179110814 /NCGR_PEP_ID=MMETSP0796-20121207/51734_1 /TAXON_ID=73915 /ORGANISM="Pyrodinium bahamense, Strain pbaha01" /LENGTH=43 /DNA_ID= /DNA_START= /DNA_END= /DNA_ORIENTATION=
MPRGMGAKAQVQWISRVDKGHCRSALHAFPDLAGFFSMAAIAN